MARSQSLSAPSVQRFVSLAGGAPQSAAQAQASSPGSQVPSPQAGGAPQSRGQLRPSSGLSHTKSPQHVLPPEPWGVSVQLKPPEVQRVSAQPTGVSPPNPQQKRPLGLPLWTPVQSWGQLRQSSPSPASQRPLPQVAAGRSNDGQSAPQLAQSSPASHTPSPHTVVVQMSDASSQPPPPQGSLPG